MKKIKNRLKKIFSKTKDPLNKDKAKLTEADLADIKSAITEIELRDR